MASLIKEGARTILHRLNAISFFRKMNQSPRILVYHDFPKTAETIECLQRQCMHICRHYHPVTMDDMAEGIASGSLKPRSIAITVDDGYRDFLDVAYPVFRKHNLPVTVYLISDFLDGKWMWWDQVTWALNETSQRQLSFDVNGTPYEFDVATCNIQEDIIEPAKRLPNSVRQELVEKLQAAAKISLPAQSSAMTWNEARRLQADGVTFGAHTKSHPIMSRVETEAELRTEITASCTRIQQELGIPVRHFCYPNGMPDDIDGRSARLAREAGLLTAVSSIGGFNSSTANYFALRRTGVDVPMNDEYFYELLAGLHDPSDSSEPVKLSDLVGEP